MRTGNNATAFQFYDAGVIGAVIQDSSKESDGAPPIASKKRTTDSASWTRYGI
jgi:hypothetical protein